MEIEGQLRHGTFRSDASRLSVADAIELYLDYCRGRMQRKERMTRGNLANLTSRLHGHALHPEYGVGHLKLAALTARRVAEFRDRMRDSGVSVPMTRKVLSSLHTMLAFCVEQDFIAANAARGTRVLGMRSEDTARVVVPTKSDVRALLDAADQDFRNVLLTAALTGVRASELRALRWRHIDFDAGVVVIETRVDRSGKKTSLNQMPEIVVFRLARRCSPSSGVGACAHRSPARTILCLPIIVVGIWIMAT